MKIVFFGPGSGIWKSLFAELTMQDSIAEYCDYYGKANSRIKQILISQKLNRLISPPLFIRRAIYRYVLKYPFLSKTDRNEPILFAMTNGYELWGDLDKFNLFMDFLKMEFPNAKFAIHLMESMQSLKGKPLLNQVLETLKKFDLVLTFNRYDSEEFGIEYYPAVSENMCVVPTGEGEDSDLFYVGSTANPNRVKLSLSVFKKASDKGLKCIFFLGGKIDCPQLIEFDALKSDDNNCYTYKNSKLYTRYIPYSSCLSYVKKSKVMLEIVLPTRFASCTARPAQCMTYKVKLLTNCPTAINEPFYRPSNVSVFTDAEDIDFGFFNTKFEGEKYNFSAPRLIEYIENKLYKD